MNTKTWVGVVVVVIVALGVWYFMSGNNAGTAPTGDQSSTGTPAGSNPSDKTVSGSGTTSGSSTIGGLLAMGKSLQCSVTMSSGGTQSEGLIYISGGKMHADFSTSADGNAINAVMINDGKYVYSWTNLSTKGLKTPVTATGGANSTSGAVDNSTAVKYSCKPWSVDAGKFVPPSSIKF